MNKKQRDRLKHKFGGFCAYCGSPLGDKWHADHVAPVQRTGHWQRQNSKMVYVQTGQMSHPERDHDDNLMPACVPCNIDKSDSSLDAWRERLERSAEVLRRNYSTYRHALRFGLITEQKPRVRFYFERRTLKEDL